MNSVGLFIAGATSGLNCGRWFESRNPATEEPLARVREATSDDVHAAVRSARRAFPAWAALPQAKRASFLFALADVLEARTEELAVLETADTGMTVTMTRGGHLPRAIAHLRYFAEESMRPFGALVPQDGAYLHLVMREPVGVWAIIVPWNAPLATATMNVGAALAMGNCCVVKPSEKAPLSVASLAEAAVEIGLPPGVLNIVQGPGISTGAMLIEHPDVDGICFVGGVETGKSIMRHGTNRVRRLLMELGGKSPTVILADADFEAAIDGALLSAFSSNGEVCTAGSRVIVERPIHNRFLERFAQRASTIKVGDPMLPETEMGPLIDRSHSEKVAQFIESAQAQGARLACGGERPSDLKRGYYRKPAVLYDVSNAMDIARQEIFGPVVAIMCAEGADDAVELANDTDYGLSATVWTADQSRGLQIARSIRAGSVAVNSPLVRDIRAPFGGMKNSGLGRVGGRWSVEQFTELKTTCLKVSGYELPRLGVTRSYS